ncbi:MAG: histidinol-phosphatase [Limnochordia bacterium]|nr:histidinol-phosphatase [Bacillota bacterium]NLL08555.1 histidinol-phosphatase [Bacillota bacterium]HBG09273.1 histidinol phosphatase [Bacillota bacterium]
MKNYHTHTFRCKHAVGEVDDYVQAAAARGLSVLGFADHTALPDNRWLFMRMSRAELPGYVRAMEEAQRSCSELVILKGMECEWAPEYHGFFQDVLLGQYALDYLVLGSHFFPHGGEWLSSHLDVYDAERLSAYTKHLIKSMQSGLFAFVAHPDLYGLTYMEWDENAAAAARDILSAAKELNLPLEINGNGLMSRVVETAQGSRTAYPWLPFWELAAEYGVSVVVNSDAHRPSLVDQGLREGLRIAETLGLPLADLDHLEGVEHV